MLWKFKVEQYENALLNPKNSLFNVMHILEHFHCSTLNFYNVGRK